MSTGVVLPEQSNVVQFPPENAVQADKEKLNNLGQQISAIVQSFNKLKQELVADSNAERKAKFIALLDQRRQAIEAAMDAWKIKAGQVGIAQQQPQLAGLGQLDLASLQNQISIEQNKLTALQSYYAAYSAAITAGQTPPAAPPELNEGFLGVSSGMLIAGIALLAAGWYFFFREK